MYTCVHKYVRLIVMLLYAQLNIYTVMHTLYIYIYMMVFYFFCCSALNRATSIQCCNAPFKCIASSVSNFSDLILLLKSPTSLHIVASKETTFSVIFNFSIVLDANCLLFLTTPESVSSTKVIITSSSTTNIRGLFFSFLFFDFIDWT